MEINYEKIILELKKRKIIKRNKIFLTRQIREDISKKLNVSIGLISKVKIIYEKLNPNQEKEVIEDIKNRKRTISSIYGQIVNPFKISKKGKYIYIIQAKNGGPIKIGIAINPRMRLKELQIGNPNELQIIKLIEGGIKEERELHRKFKKYQLINEWFKEEALDLESELKSEFVRKMKRIEKQKGIPFKNIKELRKLTRGSL